MYRNTESRIVLETGSEKTGSWMPDRRKNMQKLEKQFHIHCQEGDVGRYCILPGDPGRAEILPHILTIPF